MSELQTFVFTHVPQNVVKCRQCKMHYLPKFSLFSELLPWPTSFNLYLFLVSLEWYVVHNNARIVCLFIIDSKPYNKQKRNRRFSYNYVNNSWKFRSLFHAVKGIHLTIITKSKGSIKLNVQRATCFQWKLVNLTDVCIKHTSKRLKMSWIFFVFLLTLS